MLNRPWTPAFLLFLGITAGGPAWGQPAGAPRKHLPGDFDVRDVAAAPEALVERRRAGIESFLAASAANPGTRIQPNRFGVPKLFLREGKALTAPSTQPPEEIAKGFLQSHAAVFSLGGGEVDSLRLLMKDAAGDATFLAFNGQIKFTLSRAGEVVQVAAGDVTPGLSLSTTPRLSAEEAVRAAFGAAGAGAPAALTPSADPDGKARFLNPSGDRFNPVTAELSVFPVPTLLKLAEYGDRPGCPRGACRSPGVESQRATVSLDFSGAAGNITFGASCVGPGAVELGCAWILFEADYGTGFRLGGPYLNRPGLDSGAVSAGNVSQGQTTLLGPVNVGVIPIDSERSASLHEIRRALLSGSFFRRHSWREEWQCPVAKSSRILDIDELRSHFEQWRQIRQGKAPIIQARLSRPDEGARR